MIKVALVGAQDAGKTTLARLLTGSFSAEGYLSYYVAEYCRDYLQKIKSDQPLTLPEELDIIREQVKREQEVPDTAELMVTDSPICLAYVYSLLRCKLGSMSKKDLVYLEKIYAALWDSWSYDMVFYLVPTWEPRADGVRPVELLSQNEDIDVMIQGFLDLHHVIYTGLASDTISNWSGTLTKYVELMMPRIRAELTKAGYT